MRLHTGATYGMVIFCSHASFYARAVLRRLVAQLALKYISDRTKYMWTSKLTSHHNISSYTISQASVHQLAFTAAFRAP